MSIADKLTYLNGTKSLLREAINAAGGNLTQETPFREYVGGWLRDQSASLILDFSKQRYAVKDKVSMFPDRVGFEDIVTFTRSTAGGRFNAQGQYEWVEPDEPRIDYDPVTGECLGLLIEEQRTRLNTVSTGATLFPALSGAAYVDDGTKCLDGLTPFRKLVESTANGVHAGVPVSAPVAARTTYTASYLVKAAGRNRFRFEAASASSWSPAAPIVAYNLATGTITSVGAGSSGTIKSLGNGVFLVTFTATTGGSAFTSSIYPVLLSDAGANLYAGDGVSGIYISAYQLEAGIFGTSLIIGEGAQVTRAADLASVNELSPWYSPNQGSFSIKAKGHIGEPLLTAGDAFVIANSDELKEYQVSYSEDPQATQVEIGKGLIESIRYWPRETA